MASLCVVSHLPGPSTPCGARAHALQNQGGMASSTQHTTHKLLGAEVGRVHHVDPWVDEPRCNMLRWAGRGEGARRWVEMRECSAGGAHMNMPAHTPHPAPHRPAHTAQPAATTSTFFPSPLRQIRKRPDRTPSQS